MWPFSSYTGPIPILAPHPTLPCSDKGQHGRTQGPRRAERPHGPNPAAAWFRLEARTRPTLLGVPPPFPGAVLSPLPAAGRTVPQK